MKGRQRMRDVRRIAATLAATLAATTFAALPATHSDAATGSVWVLHPAATTLHQDGHKYQIQMWVADSRSRGDHEHEQVLDVVITSHASAGVDMHAVQRHFYTYLIDDVDQPAFTHSKTLKRAAIDIWNHKFGELELDVQYRSVGGPDSSCDGHTTISHGTLTGTFVLRPPHDSLGRITQFSSRATLAHGDGTCAVAHVPQPKFVSSTPCPSTTRVATGWSKPTNNLMNIIARHDPDSPIATINVTSSNNGPPYAWHTIEAVVPADHVDIASDLSSVTLRGGRGTFLKGTARATENGPPSPWIAPAGCPNHSNVEGSLEADEGTFRGDFTAQYFLGVPRRVKHLEVDATAFVDMQQSG